MDPQAPPVVAVVVTADPGEWFEDTLGGLAAQDYPNLSVLVIDAGSAVDPTPRVAAILPGAYVRRLPGPTGYAAAANEALQVVEGASFYLMCHDDVALDRDAVRLLVEEAFRSNAGVVAPKLVSWEDPSRLLQVGMSADRGGLPVPLAQPGELDQEQHDSVRDVFVAPGAAVLVRADLFATLGGYDAAMVLFGEDVDLSWRAQTAGARVLVAPAARARHREALSRGLRPVQDIPGLPPGGRGGGRELALARRHELRAALKAYGAWHLVRVAPLLAAHTAAEAVAGTLGGHPGAARAAVGAWSWNLRRTRELRRLRSEVAAHRVLPDAEVRRLQSASGARISGLVEGMASRASARVAHMPHLPPPGGIEVEEELRDEGLIGSDAVGSGDRVSWAPLLVWTVIAVVLVIGARGLLSAGPPDVGQMAPFPSFGHLLAAYTSSTRPVGLGQVAAAPLMLALAGVLGAVLGGSAGLAQTVLVVGLVPLGALGAYRLARALGSRWSGLVAPVVYLALPLPYDDMAHGRWVGLAAYAAAPWLLGLALRGSGLEPFTPGTRGRRRWVAAALVLALAGAVGPGVVVAALVAGVGLVLGALLGGQVRSTARGALVLLAGAAGAWLLAFPWSAGMFVPGGQAAAVLGVPEAVFRAAGAGSLLAFHPVSGGTQWVGWALLPGMAAPVLFGRDWRLGWGMRLWGAALACWLVAWAGGRGWLGARAPEPAALLAMAGAALSLSAALGVAAFERDLTGHSLGWRQAVSAIGVVGVALASFGAVGQMGNGRWHAPTDDLRAALGALPAPAPGGGYRVLWVGDPAALPLGAWELAPGVGYATATVSAPPRGAGGSDASGQSAVPDATYGWPPPDPGALTVAAGDLGQVEAGRTVQAGRDLAVLGVRYVVVPEREAPSSVRDLSAPVTLTAGLADQLDLRPIPAGTGLLLYENTDWHPGSGPPPPRPAGGSRAAELALEAVLWLVAVGYLVRTRAARAPGRAGRETGGAGGAPAPRAAPGAP